MKKSSDLLSIGASNVLIKFASQFTVLIAIPILISNIGIDNFGLFFAFISILNFLLAFDGGIGSSLIRLVAKCQTQSKFSINDVLLNAFWTSFVISLTFQSLFIAITAFFEPWNHFASLNQINFKNFTLFCSFVICLLSSTVMNFLLKALVALSHINLANLLNFLSTLLQYTFLILISSNNVSLDGLIGTFAITNLISASISILFVKWKYLRVISAKQSPGSMKKELLKSGRLFQILQVISVLTTQFGGVYVLAILDAEQSGIYTGLQKIFLPIIALVTIYFQPYWNYFALRDVKNEHREIGSTLKSSFFQIASFSCVFSLVFILFGEKIFNKWTGVAINLPETVLVFGVISTISFLFCIPLANFFNGLHAEKFLILASISNLILGIITSVLFTREIGIAGPFVSSIVSNSLTIIIPGILYLRKTAWKKSD